MSKGILEHVNITVSNPEKTAPMLCEIFGWHVRWHGAALAGGETYHVGTDDAYMAVYSPPATPTEGEDNYMHKGGLNHVGILVDDLDAVEKRINTSGFETFNHQQYEPGSRFYFNDPDNIEYEVVSYA